MTEELKQKAEEYVEGRGKELFRKFYDNNLSMADLIRTCCIEFATENGIQWHDLRKDPNDLPKDCGLFIIYWKLGSINNYMVFKGNLDAPHKDMIAWCEIPTFKE